MPDDPGLILTADNRDAVVAAIFAAGRDPMGLNNVQLANLYHEVCAGPSAAQIAAAETLINIMTGLYGRAPAAPVATLVHYRTDAVLRAVRRKHPVMLVGPAGCGKTTIGEHVANELRLPFRITNTINDTHELMGFVDGHGKYHPTPFRDAFEHGGLWIADEIDAWDAAALLAANSALANGYANFPDRSEHVVRHADFRMVATANTFGTGADRIYVGRNELDAASLDRFAVIEVDYDLTLERFFARGADEWLEYVWSIRKQVNEKRVRHVVSSRAVAMGAAAIHDGETWDDVCEIYLYKSMSSKDRSKLDA